jgi:hypothetical protein
MEKLMNSDSTVMQLWNPITPRNSEDEGDMFSEMLVLTRVTWYKATEDLYKCYHHENIAEDGVL